MYLQFFPSFIHFESSFYGEPKNIYVYEKKKDVKFVSRGYLFPERDTDEK